MKLLSRPLLLLALLLPLGCGDAPLEEPAATTSASGGDTDRATQVQNGVRHYLNSLESGDAAALVDHMHPRYLEQLGDRNQAKENLERNLNMFKAAGMQFAIDEPTFYRDPDFLQAGDLEFAVIPYKVVMSAGDESREMTSFQVAVLDKGATNWKYVDMGQQATTKIRELFPEFPADYQFPETKMSSL